MRRARKVQRWSGASASALAQRVKHHADANTRPQTVSSEVAQRTCGPDDRNFKSTALAPRESDLALVPSATGGDPAARFARRHLRAFLPFARRLDVRRIVSRHRTLQAILRAVNIDPSPDHLGIALGGRDVDRAAMAVTAGSAAAAVQRVAGARLEARGEALAIVVTERAQHGPLNTVGIHRAAGTIELLAETGVHPFDHVFLQRQAHAAGGSRIFPGEVAGGITFDRLALIDLPEVIVDLIHRAAAAGLAVAPQDAAAAVGLHAFLRREGREAVHLDQTARGFWRRRRQRHARRGIEEADGLDRAPIVRDRLIALV